jgi:integrase/recombinase XerD
MTAPRLSETMKRYQIDKEADGLSPKSIEATIWAIQRLSDYLGNPNFDDVQLPQLRAFMAYMRKEYQPVRKSGDRSPLAPASLDRVWGSIRSFYRWAEVELGSTRPDLGLTRPEYKAPIIKPFTQDQIRMLINAAEMTIEANTERRKPFRMKRPLATRDKAIILFLLDTGVRVSECERVKIQHVDLELGEVEITPFRSSRKSRPRTVYLGVRCRKILWRYLDTRECYPEDELFETVNGRPMCHNCIRHMLSRTGKRAGVPKCHPHRFRHTFAIQYLRNGGDIFTLQKLLGHSSLAMVQKYLDIVKDDSKDAHRSASPVDRWRL